MKTDGDGIINRLFYLKNQDLQSDDYRKYKEIYDTFLEITDCVFNIVPNEDNKISLYFCVEDKWRNSDDCGLGLSDVLVIITMLIDNDDKFIFLEEPENHLHASFQKKLLFAIKNIKEKQFFISTHSSVFLDIESVDKIFYIENKDKIKISDQTRKSIIINNLGYSVSENLVSDIIILTEGPTDIIVLKKLLNERLKENVYNIKFWPLGGDIMSSLDLSVFSENKNVVALIDSDPGSSVQRTRFQRKCKEHEIFCHKLKRYSIENYFSMESLRKVFPRQIPVSIKELNPVLKVDKQIGFDAKNKSIKNKIEEVIQEMAIEEFEETDLIEFVDKVIELLND